MAMSALNIARPNRPKPTWKIPFIRRPSCSNVLLAEAAAGRRPSALLQIPQFGSCQLRASVLPFPHELGRNKKKTSGRLD